MRKPNLKIFVSILFISGCSQKIAAQRREESNVKNIIERDDGINPSDYSDSKPVSKCA